MSDNVRIEKEPHCALYVNDSPDRRDGHANYYDRRPHVVAVSFVSHDGRATRVSFDPDTGEFTTYDLTEAQHKDAA